MKCFNHNENEAVAICKSCSKGLCKECLTEINQSIACTSTCIESVKQLDFLITKSMKSYKTTSFAYYKNAFLYGCFGIVFLLYGLVTNGSSSFLTILGAVFLMGAMFSLWTAYKFKREAKNYKDTI